jgi:lactate dehydrogenase-like 2-hydroxyacid dehydrogenase
LQFTTMTLCAVYDARPYDREPLQRTATGADLTWRFLEYRLTSETRHLIRGETLELMKPGVALTNVSRGGLIETRALIQALKSVKLDLVGRLVQDRVHTVICSSL